MTPLSRFASSPPGDTAGSLAKPVLRRSLACATPARRAMSTRH